MEYETPPEVIAAAERAFRELPADKRWAVAELLCQSHKAGRKLGRNEAGRAFLGALA